MSFPSINWLFELNDRGTHSGNYLSKLNQLVSEINGQINAYNAQVAAATDALQIKNDTQILLDSVTTLHGQTIALRDATEAIALGSINGTSPTFSNMITSGIYKANNNLHTFESAVADVNGIQIKQSNVGGDALMTFHIGGDYAAHFGLNADNNKWSVGGWSMGAVAYALYHEGNKPTPAELGATVNASADSLVLRNANGYIYGNYLNMTGTFDTADSGQTLAFLTGSNGVNNYGYSYSLAKVKAALDIEHTVYSNTAQDFSAVASRLITLMRYSGSAAVTLPTIPVATVGQKVIIHNTYDAVGTVTINAALIYTPNGTGAASHTLTGRGTVEFVCINTGGHWMLASIHT